MPVTFAGGAALPAPGTAGYAAAQSGSGFVSSGGSNQYSSNTAPAKSSAPAGSYTFTSNGQTFIASPTANTTAAQAQAVANNPAFTPITPNSLNNQNLVPLPQKVQPQIDLSTVTSAMPALGQVDNNGLLKLLTGTIGAQQSPEQQNVTATSAQNLLSYLGLKKPPVNTSQEYAKLEQEAGIAQKRQAVNDYTAQLNQIVAKAQADQLRLEGQGRGIPESIIGGQQAKIAREAAIAALPVQAQLAAAQGNLTFAQNRLDTLFKLKVADLQAENDYYNNTLDAVYNWATEQEKRSIEDLRLKADRSYKEQQANLALADSYAKYAVQNGQGNLVPSIVSLDPSSSTFRSDLGSVTSQLTLSPKDQLELTKAGLEIKKLEQETTGAKPLTAAQANSYGFATRAVASNDILLNLSGELSQGEAYFSGIIPNALKSSTRQRFEQAERDFINAVLRKESGAVIGKDEFKDARLQYIPQPGDTAATIKQKEANRINSINGLLVSAGQPEISPLSNPASNADLDYVNSLNLP